LIIISFRFWIVLIIFFKEKGRVHYNTMLVGDKVLGSQGADMIKRKAEQVIEVRKNMRGGAGEVTIRHCLNKEEIRAKCRLCAQLVLPPGAGIGPHHHDNEDEVFIIQQGQGVVTDSGKEMEVEAGDAVLTGKGDSHSIQNTGENDLVVTAIIMPY
jgi:mannose-6-phosphate isomerase-like protein (cupin superfamily)